MSLDKDISVLREVSLFQGFNDEHLRLLAFGGEHRQLSKGEALFRSGEFADSGFVILSGRVELRSADGKTVLWSGGRGALLGERAIITKVRRPANAVAQEATIVLQIRRSLLQRMFDEYPQLAQHLSKIFAGRIKDRADGLAKISPKLR